MRVLGVRRTAALLVLALGLAACNAADEGTRAPAPADADGGDGGVVSDGGVNPGGAESPPGVPSPPDTGQPGPNDLGPLGAMCRPMLRAKSLTVEIDWQAGAKPEASAVDHLVSVLRSVVAGDVTLAGGTEIPGQGDTWTTAALQGLAAAHRSQYSHDDAAALYVLSVRGNFHEEAALGVAHRASEVALFPDRMGGLTALLGGRAALERAVLVHEAGHLLCLVNIGFSSAHDREDAEHPHHSSDRSSVMHWAIDTSAVSTLFNGPPPADFTAQDRDDLARLRTGQA